MTVRPPPARPRPFVEAIEPRLLFATFIVTTTADSGPDSLRQAILSSNANDTPTPTDDRIEFNIAPEGRHTINLLSPLPQITGNLTVDATTQPGYRPNHTPVVTLNGQSAGVGADGLRVASTGPGPASNVLGLVIAGFSGNGVVIGGNNNTLAQCYIGTDATGAAPGPGNAGHGLYITGDGNVIADSIIAFNGLDGAVVTPAATGNAVAPNAANTYFSNGGLAIDLGDDGPTPNDPGDADDGANRLQNHPVITSVTAANAPATGVEVTGTINTTPNTLVEVVLYSSPTSDGEGRNLVEVLRPFSTNASGNGTFSANLPAASATDWFTAAVTSYTFSAEMTEANSSEFSPPVTATPPQTLITEVYVKGSTWPGQDNNAGTTNFMEFLEAKGLGDDVMGYRLHGPSRTPPAANPEDIIPWINADQIVVRYAVAPTGAGIPTTGTVTVAGRNPALSSYTVTAVTQVPGDPTAYVLQLNKPLGGGNPATGVAPSGDENGDYVTLGVPGGGAGGGNFSLRMEVLQGDTDHLNETAETHAVLARDFAEVKKKFFKDTTSAVAGDDTDYTPFHDVDGSGSILARDFAEVKKRFFQALPPPTALPSNVMALTVQRVTRDLFGTAVIL